MAHTPKHLFVRSCVLTIILVLAVFLSFRVLPTAQADEPCLKIAFPEPVQSEGLDHFYRLVMRKAGLCVETVHMPNARALMAVRHGEVDGVFAGLDEFGENVGVPVVRGTVPVGNPDGLLVIKEGGVSALSALTNETVGAWQGVLWSEGMMENYPHVVLVPGGPEMMMEMLLKGRIDAMLINGHSLGVLGGAPEGYVASPIAKLAVYSWLNAKHEALLPQFDEGTKMLREQISELRKK